MTLRDHPKPPDGKIVSSIPSGYDPTGKDDVPFDSGKHADLVREAQAAKKSGKHKAA